MGIWEVGTERIEGRGNLSGCNIYKNKKRKMISFPIFSFPCVFYEAMSNKLNWNFILGSFFDSDFMINDYVCLFLFNMLKKFLDNFCFSFQNFCVEILLAGYWASCTNYQVILSFLHYFLLFDALHAFRISIVWTLSLKSLHYTLLFYYQDEICIRYGSNTLNELLLI